jgi:hypothetical protein
VIRQSLYPQFPENLSAQPDVDPTTDEHTAECKWLGERMDIHMVVSEMFRLDEKNVDQAE